MQEEIFSPVTDASKNVFDVHYMSVFRFVLGLGYLMCILYNGYFIVF